MHLLEPGNTPEGSVSTGIGTDISLQTDETFPACVQSPPVCEASVNELSPHTCPVQ